MWARTCVEAEEEVQQARSLGVFFLVLLYWCDVYF